MYQIQCIRAEHNSKWNKSCRLHDSTSSYSTKSDFNWNTTTFLLHLSIAALNMLISTYYVSQFSALNKLIENVFFFFPNYTSINCTSICTSTIACAQCCYITLHKELPTAVLPFSLHHIFSEETKKKRKKTWKKKYVTSFPYQDGSGFTWMSNLNVRSCTAEPCMGFWALVPAPGFQEVHTIVLGTVIH